MWSWWIRSYECRVVQDSTIWSRLSVALYVHFLFLITKSKTSCEELTVIQLLYHSLFRRNPKFHCIAHESQPLAIILSQWNTFATILSYIPRSILNCPSMYVLICFFCSALRNPLFISRFRYSYYIPRIFRSSRFYGSNMLGVFVYYFLI